MRQLAATVTIRLSDPDDDPQRLELATAALRGELLELNVDDVVPPPAAEAPGGTRGVDIAMIGNLLVMLPQLYESLCQLTVGVQRWLARDTDGRTAELVINGDRLVVTGVDSATQQRLIEAWVRAHALDHVSEGESWPTAAL